MESVVERTRHRPGVGAARRGLVAAGLATACLALAAPAAAAPEGVLRPTVTCVDVNDDGTVTAHFGYTNTWGHDVTMPAGHRRNFFLPPPGDRGQPSSFSPGTFDDVFSVTFSGLLLSWQLGDDDGIGVAIATRSSPRCTNVPAMGVDSPWPALLAAVGLGIAITFRRRTAGSAVARG